MPPGFSLSHLKKLAPPPRPVCLVPTAFCFLHRENKPAEAVKPADVQAFVSLTIEGVSPFPAEQLAWGWLDAPKQSFVWIMAATKERLAREAVALDKNAAFALPAFAAVCALGMPKARRIFLWEENTLTGLRFTENSLWPVAIVSVPLPEATIEAAFAARERLCEDKALGHAETLPGLYAEPEGRADPSDNLSFQLAYFENAQDPAKPVTVRWPRRENALLWQADLRERDFLKQEIKRRKRSAILWYACEGAAVAAVLLLLWQIGLSFADKSLASRFALIETQKPLVAAVQQNQSLLMKIEQASGNELQPYRMLGKLNQVRLADEITKALYFINAQTDGLTGLTVQGKASSIAQVNTYVEALKKSNYFKTVDLTNVQSKYAGADFTLKVEFKPLGPSDRINRAEHAAQASGNQPVQAVPEAVPAQTAQPAAPAATPEHGA